MRYKLTFLPLVSLTILLAVGSVHGQVPQGAIQGNVIDPTGGRLVGAELTLENEQTGIKRTLSTSDEGLYSFNYLDSGSYQLTIQASGFKTGIYKNIRVQIGEKVRVDAKLEVGEVTSSVEVSGAAAILQTDTATVGSLISRREINDIPVKGREFSQLALLLPGARIVGTTGGEGLGTQLASRISIGGTSADKNNYTVDGVDNTLNLWNGPAMNPSLDSIEEFRIDRSMFSAEYGRGGAQLHLVTKAGTNAYHGVLWEYLRNKVLNAGNYVSHQQENLKRNQFGANFGGPIIRNKLFFFGNWESQRETSTQQFLGTVFTDSMRRGDLTGYPKVVIDPGTGQPFPGNVIPSNRINPVSIAYMDAMMPRANLPGFVNNLLRTFPTQENWDQLAARLDYQVSPKDNLFFRASHQTRDGFHPFLSAASIPLVDDYWFFNAGAGWNRTWSPRLTTETRFGFHRERLFTDNEPVPNPPNPTIKGFGAVQPGPQTLPIINITDVGNIAQWALPSGWRPDSYEFVENLTLLRGKHLIKAGYTGRKQNMERSLVKEYGMFLSFGGSYSGTGPGDYLLGIPFSVNETLGEVPRIWPVSQHSAFVQDDWKITPSLTLNLGLRYELNTVPYDKNDLFGTFSPEREKIVVAGDGVVQFTPNFPDPFILNAYKSFIIPATQVNIPPRTLVFGDHNNFAPRVSFAWRPFDNNKTVLRGGYGVFYILEDLKSSVTGLSSTPYGGSVQVVNTVPNPTFRIDDPFSAGAATPPPPFATYRDPYLRFPYLQQLTIGIQHELPWRMVGEINFQDQNSKKLETGWNLNQPAPGPGPVQPRRPFQTIGPNIQANFHEGRSRYDALEMSLRKTSTHFTFQWSHTWAKNLARLSPVDPYNRDLFYGPQDYIPHMDKFHFVADLPFGKGMKFLNRGGGVDAVLGGWTVSGFVNIQSGPPLTITWAGDPANVGRFGAYPNRIASGKVDNPTMAKWFDPSAFVAPTPFTFGNSGTGILFGPGWQFFDFSIHKNFTLKENVKLQFRSEMFNVLNHPNLAMPGTSANGLAFGQILTKNGPGGTVFARNLDPRIIQFALRLNF